nr:uncharacterized protein LOC119180100 isoform X2 [Rhipicephalus microplus]
MAHGDFSCCASPAADVIAHALANQVNHNDIQSIIQCQKQVFLKMKLAQQYPAAFSACNTVFYAVDEEDEPEERHPPPKAQAEKLVDATEKQKHISGQQLQDSLSGSSPQSSVTS